MVALMAEKREKKVNIGVRLLPSVKGRLESIAEQISKERYPASITAGELAAVAIDEYIARFEKHQARSK